MCLVWLSDNSLFAVACVHMWETQVITEDSAREFPQCRLWPRSVFRQLLFCVCASALHTPSQRTREHYRHTAEQSQTLKLGNQTAEGQLTVLFLLSLLFQLCHTSCPQAGSPPVGHRYSKRKSKQWLAEHKWQLFKDTSQSCPSLFPFALKFMSRF